MPPEVAYRIPETLLDLVLVDLLELTGSTISAAGHLALSQPTVSRRYRALAQDLGLKHNSHNPVGRRYGDTKWMELLRRGVNHHRLEAGVLRIGNIDTHAVPLPGSPLVQWIDLGKGAIDAWPKLLSLELLDAVVTHEKTLPQPTARIHTIKLPSPADKQNRVLIYRDDPMVTPIATQILRDISS